MQFLYKFGSSRKQKQRPLEAEDLDGLFESKKYLNFLLLYKYMKIWYFHRQYKVFWETIKYLTIFLVYIKWTKELHTFKRKTKCSYIHSSIQTKKVGKYYQTKLLRALFRTLPNIYNKAFLHHRCLIWSQIQKSIWNE